MRRKSAAAAIGCALALTVCLSPAVGQGPGILSTQNRGPQEIGPPLRLERSADGTLQRIPGLTLEDLEQLWRQQKGLETPPAPPATIESLRLSGHAESANRLPLEGDVVVRTSGPGWVRVALRLPEIVWLGQPKTQTGDVYLERAESGETICWLRPRESKDRHELRLSGAANLATWGQTHRLRLTLPRSAVSRLTLELGSSPVELKLTAGQAQVATEKVKGQTRGTIDGGDGPIEVAWGPPSSPNPSSTVEANGKVRIDAGSSAIRWEARLTLRAHGAPLGSVRVELPAGARMLPRDSVDYQLAVDEPATDGRSSVTIAPRSPERQQLEVLLVAERPSPAENEALDLAGFLVEGAARQAGEIEIHVEGHRTAQWGTLVACRELEARAGSESGDSWLGRFEYDRQPFKLPLTLAARAKRVLVEPRYEIAVESDRLVCVGRWRYRVDGAPLDAVEFDAGDWTIDRWGPAELLREFAGSESPLRLPQPQNGAFELAWRAVLPLPSAQQQVELKLPRPRAATLLPAEIEIASAENCAVIPAGNDEGRWMLREGASAATSRPWRVEAHDLARPLAFQRIVHPGELRAEGAAQVRIGAHETVLEQALRVTARYERRSAVALRIPQALLSAGDPEVTLSGVKLPLAIDRTGNPSICDAWVVLPEPALGVIELRLHATLPHGAAAPGQLSIPLPTTADAKWDAQHLAVQCAPGLVASPIGGAWHSSDSGATWENPDPAPSIDVEIKTDGRPSATIDRAWVQTSWGAGLQQTRAVYRLVSGRDSMVVRFSKSPQSLLAWADGQAIVPRDLGSGRHELRWPSKAPSHVLELSYSTPDPDPWQKALAPELESDVVASRMYWHLPEANATRLWSTPAGFADELAWTWTAWGFERRALCGAATLELWSGAQASGSPRSADAGYLFSASQYRSSLEPPCVSRTWHILVASTLCLVGGLALLLLPARRRTITWGAALLIVGGLLLFPAPTLEALQAGLLGLVLVGVAAVLQYRQSRRTVAPPRSRGSSVTRPDSSTRIRTLPPVAGDALREAAEPSSESRR